MKLSKRKIYLLLAEKEMSWDELAARAETTRQNLSRIFNNGNTRPKTIGKVAHALGVKVEDILED